MCNPMEKTNIERENTKVNSMLKFVCAHFGYANSKNTLESSQMSDLWSHHYLATKESSHRGTHLLKFIQLNERGRLIFH